MATTNPLSVASQQSRIEATTGKRRILFVDDDELFLRGLERTLKRQSEPGWSLCFVKDGASALRELDKVGADVIVVDAHMPGMSGNELLRNVQERHPGIVRILLSSNTGIETLRSALPYAHQFLPKPCEPPLLELVLANACRLRELLGRPEMRELVSSSNALPSAPRTYMDLSQVLSDPKSSSRAIADIVEKDIAISARILQLVSSAFYGPPRTVTSIGGAVAFLGIDLIKAIVLSVEVSRMFPAPHQIAGFSIEALQKRSLRVAQLAKRMLGHEGAGDLLLIAGMLQDIGQLVLAARAPQRFSIALAVSAKGKVPLFEAELELFGTTHAEIGSYLLGLWGIPERIVQTVALHLQPQQRSSRRFDAAGALYVANHLLQDPDVAALEEIPNRTIALDLKYLRTLGVAHLVDDWRKLSRELASVPALRAAARI